jgi:hypothetical protein
MWSYVGGRVRPSGDRRAKLYELTGLSCFASEPGPPEWVKWLELQARAYIDGLPAKFYTKKKYREFTRRILIGLASAGVASSTEITPATLLQHPPAYKLHQTRRAAMVFMAGLLLELGIWTQAQNEDLKMAVKIFYPHHNRKTARPPKQTSQPSSMDALVVLLVVKAGLGVQQVRELRVTQIEPDGIRLGPSRLLRFGESSHQIPKSTLDSYLSESNPQSFLFYSFRPPDYSRPISRVPIARILREAKLTMGAGIPVETVHLKEDFQFIPSPRRLRAHLRYFHDLSARATWIFMKKYYAQATAFVLPKPYILAVLCASRLLDEAANLYRGGKTYSYTWHSLAGYDVKVSWPASLFQELRDQKIRPGIARQLLRFGQDRWRDSGGLTGRRKLQALSRLMDHWRKLKDPMSRRVGRRKLLTDEVNQLLLNRLELTRIEIRDTSDSATWAGPLLRRTEKGPLLPLLDQLEGGPTNPRCPICGHPDRDAIDAEIRAGQSTFAAIARKYGLAYGPENHQLLWHAGRITLNGLPGHLGSAPASPTVRFPINFLAETSKANAPQMAERLLLSLGTEEQTMRLAVRPRLRVQTADQ